MNCRSMASRRYRTWPHCRCHCHGSQNVARPIPTVECVNRPAFRSKLERVANANSSCCLSNTALASLAFQNHHPATFSSISKVTLLSENTDLNTCLVIYSRMKVGTSSTKTPGHFHAPKKNRLLRILLISSWNVGSNIPVFTSTIMHLTRPRP